jgi:hypothetical protein
MNVQALSARLQRIVDRQCDAYEAAWGAGQRPGIEAYVHSVEAQARESLLEELLFAEIRLRFQKHFEADPERGRADGFRVLVSASSSTP